MSLRSKPPERSAVAEFNYAPAKRFAADRCVHAYVDEGKFENRSLEPIIFLFPLLPPNPRLRSLRLGGVIMFLRWLPEPAAPLNALFESKIVYYGAILSQFAYATASDRNFYNAYGDTCG